MNTQLLAAVFPPEGITDADYPAYLQALLGSEELATKGGGWVLVRRDDEPADEGAELAWEEYPGEGKDAYKPRKPGNKRWKDTDTGAVKYGAKKPKNEPLAKKQPQKTQVEPTEKPTAESAEPAPEPAAGRGSRVLYSGVVLDRDSREKLLREIRAVVPIPEGWKVIAHHMTTAFGKALPAELVGKKGNLRVTHVGIDQKLGVMAVKVESDIPSENATPHITIAVRPDSKPQFSNQITQWKPLKTPLSLSGKAQDVRSKPPVRKPLDPDSESAQVQAPRLAEQSRRIAQEYRQAGDESRAQQYENLAEMWEYGELHTPSPTKDNKPTPQVEEKPPEVLNPAQPTPLRVKSDPGTYRVRGESPQDASLRMNSHLEAWMDRDILRQYQGKSDDPLHGVGTHGKQKQTVFPIAGKYYVVDMSRDRDGRYTQALREVPQGEVAFRKKRKKPV